MSRVLMCLCCLLPALVCAAPQVSVRSQLLNGDNAVVGGTVTLQVDVLVDTWFRSPPQLPKLVIDGAVVTPPSGEALHLTEKNNGTTLFGLRFNYQITPLSALAYDIPALGIEVSPGQNEQVVSVTTTAQHFSASQPTGALRGEALLVAQQVELAQTVVKSHDPLRVGDTITRAVQTRAPGAQAMLITAPPFAEVKGLGRYVQPPRVYPLEDGRGGVSGGARDDSVVYRVTEEGHFSLPVIEMRWWSAGDGQAHSASVPAITFDAKAGANDQGPFSMAEDLRALRHSAHLNIARHWLVVLTALVVGGLLVCFGRTWAHAFRAGWQRRREQRNSAWLNSVQYAWQLARQQLAARPPRLDGLYLWVRRSSGRVDLQSFLGNRSSPLMQGLQQLLSSLYAPDKPGSAQTPTALLGELQKVHRRHAPKTGATYDLKPLRPQSTREARDERERHASVL